MNTITQENKPTSNENINITCSEHKNEAFVLNNIIIEKNQEISKLKSENELLNLTIAKLVYSI